MADNISVLDAAGLTVPVAADEIGGFKFQRVKLTSGADGTATDVSSAAPLPVSTVGAALPAGTDKSGSITTGGTAQVLAAANSARVRLTGQNISAGDLWINEIGGTAAVDTVGSYKVQSLAAFSISTNRAISIIGATTGQKFSATEV